MILLGAAGGDIAGSRFEWNNIKTKDFELFTDECRATDDTVITAAVALALAVTYYESDGAMPADMLEKNTTEFMREFGRDYPDAGYGGMFARWLQDEYMGPYNSFGNGSAMRVSACGWAGKTPEEVERLAAIVTRVTHNHPEGIKGAVATALAVYYARTGKSKEEIREIMSGMYDLDFTLDEIRDTYQYDVTCQGTVPQALAAFLEADSYEDAVRNAISIGGDSDTLAAITGSIAEAYFGIPEDIQEAIAERIAQDTLWSSLVKFNAVFEAQLFWRGGR